ncbi:hypothetical protein ASE75_05970 [Sphingomonas sp. Leaf17]|uniref:hypothetical protein n=1 Tax=Sphingomonas sp. Leaf17 TaxID=1735683 RepID=UPI0006F8C0F3|nr:hypothetical protein [Sphingomonas sp. Leaf17]KQM65776.1 hypothetical protein ASE75_05970 [Sphingomonas sp. Leaf17]
MTRIITAIILANLACACATIQAPPRDAVDRAQAAYDRIAATAQIILPYVSPARAARIQLALSLAERGLIAARLASTLAEQRAALARAEAATAIITTPDT